MRSIGKLLLYVALPISLAYNAYHAYHSTDSQTKPKDDIEVVSQRKAKIAIIPAGENKIALLEPTEPGTPLAQFLEEKGEGLHHLAFQVDNIEQELEELKKKGVHLIDQEPGTGVHKSRVAFLDSKATKILLQLTEIQ